MNQKCRRVPRSRRRLQMVSCEGRLRVDTDRERLASALRSERHAIGNREYAWSLLHISDSVTR